LVAGLPEEPVVGIVLVVGVGEELDEPLEELLPTGTEVLLAGWPMAPVLLLITVCSESGS
jgi:hypothetical protein